MPGRVVLSPQPGMPFDPYASLCLGNLAYIQSDTPDDKEWERLNRTAFTSYKSVMKLRDCNAYAANGLGIVLAERGQLTEARSVFTMIREAMPDLTPVVLNLAHVLVRAALWWCEAVRPRPLPLCLACPASAHPPCLWERPAAPEMCRVTLCACVCVSGCAAGSGRAGAGRADVPPLPTAPRRGAVGVGAPVHRALRVRAAEVRRVHQGAQAGHSPFAQRPSSVVRARDVVAAAWSSLSGFQHCCFCRACRHRRRNDLVDADLLLLSLLATGTTWHLL
jgi:hypothetical protein